MSLRYRDTCYLHQFELASIPYCMECKLAIGEFNYYTLMCNKILSGKYEKAFEYKFTDRSLLIYFIRNYLIQFLIKEKKFNTLQKMIDLIEEKKLPIRYKVPELKEVMGIIPPLNGEYIELKSLPNALKFTDSLLIKCEMPDGFDPLTGRYENDIKYDEIEYIEELRKNERD